MKKTILKLLSLALVAALPATWASAQVASVVANTLPGVPQAAAILATAPPQVRADGQPGVQLGDREGNTKAVLGHAEYTEPARRGKLFTLAANAYTIIAANASATAIGSWKPIVGFYNPLGSGVNAVIVGHKEFHTSGTPGGPLMWNFFCGQNWSSTVSGTIFNNLLSNNTPNGSAMIAQNNTAVGTTPAISTAANVLGVASGPAAVVIATGTGETGAGIDHKGDIVVPPGCVFGLASTATGTSDVVSASITWEEVAQ